MHLVGIFNEIYQIGTRCQLETDVASNTPPPVKVWCDNQSVKVKLG